MSIQFTGKSYSLRKVTVLTAGLGLLIVAGVSQSFAEANCPAWTTPVCRAWNLGPPPTCREWGCAADKASDPIKNQSLLNSGLFQADPGGRPTAGGGKAIGAATTATGGVVIK